ncbi:MAG: hypothetical protein ACRDQW_00990, partial [Haloechinothrix sp.]
MMDAMVWWMALWGALGLALRALVGVVTVRLIRHRAADGHELSASPAEGALQQRYAAGEISHDEYLERLAILRNSQE